MGRKSSVLFRARLDRAPRRTIVAPVTYARVVFAASWILCQAGLILSAGSRPDHAFGFRMFPEASTMKVHLSRETAVGPAPAPGGEWSARDAAGQLRHFSWRDRVRDPVLSQVDVRVFASYGLDAQLSHLERALADVAGHIPEDSQTLRLRADVEVSRNGGAMSLVTLQSPLRRGH
jgi:hypothetical protein